MSYKKICVCCIALGTLVCCTTAPKPAECKGEFKPINTVVQKGALLDKSGKLVRCNEGIVHGKQG